jgi:hypothetical protein
LHSKSGSALEMSNNPNLMLEEPEFRTRMASDMIEIPGVKQVFEAIVSRSR